MPLRIKINNLNKKRRIEPKPFKNAVKRLLSSKGISEALIDITFVTNERIRKLNKRYMQESTTTDVLSFSLGGISPRRNRVLIGDIYISSDMAYSNAERFKTNFRKEALRYAIHGVLHCLGFDDRTAGEKNRMRRLEEKYLRGVRDKG